MWGVLYLGFRKGRHDGKAVEKEDMEKNNYCHKSQKSQAITEPVQCPKTGYIVEYAAPLELFLKYSGCSLPKKGTVWRSNFYKCGVDTPEPSWGVWSEGLSPKPDYHRPEYFGELVFR